MRYLGIDYGSKRIGVAVSDEAGGFAFPKSTIPNDASSIDRISKIISQENIKTIVCGDTRADTGAPNRVTDEADVFIDRLAAHVKLPVHRVREAWSSSEAARYSPKGEKRDDAAAAIILQRYLDGNAADAADDTVE